MIEFVNAEGGSLISVRASLITLVEESADINGIPVTYIVTAGNKGFGVRHSYKDVLRKIWDGEKYGLANEY
jgi:hypothetical protein